MKRWLLWLIKWWQELGLCPDCQHPKGLHYTDIDGDSYCLGHMPGKSHSHPGYWCSCVRGF